MMTTNRWIDGSCRLFDILLHLYPGEHRADYAKSMHQVFIAQCQDSYKEHGFVGLILLWLRVLPDLGYTAIMEHLTSPRATWGLMEPVPNAPLPWKGIFLILLPGLVYLVSQIAQLTGFPWYMTVYYRAAFILIIPVLFVWVATRRFPLWGLIPVGLLFRLVKEIGYQLITLHPGTFSTNPFLDAILSLARLVESNLFIPSTIFAVVSLVLAIKYFRKNRANRAGKIWLGSFILISLVRTFFDFFSYVFTAPVVLLMEKTQSPMNEWMNANFFQRIPMAFDIYKQVGLMDMLISNASYVLYEATALILLIFVGTLFTRRHGFFTIFILVGYFLPAMLVGLPVEVQNDPGQLLLISIVVMVYRSLLSLIAPIWMSRTTLLKGKKRVIVSCITAALIIRFAMQYYPFYLQNPVNISFDLWQISTLLDDLLLIVSLLLGVTLYQGDPIGPAESEMTKDRPLGLSLEKS